MATASPPPLPLLRHLPVLSAGFRPFFLAGATWAVVGLALLLGSLGGTFDLPGEMTPLTWHCHERGITCNLPPAMNRFDGAALATTALALAVWVEGTFTPVAEPLLLVAAASQIVRLARWQGTGHWPTPSSSSCTCPTPGCR